MEPQKALRADRLVKSYGGRAVVRGVSVSVDRGEVVGLLGPNGAGKTTTFYMIVGLARPEEGRVFLGGDELTGLPMFQRARAGIGYLPQEPSIFRKLTVEQNLLAVLETLALTEEKREERLATLLEELSISPSAQEPSLCPLGRGAPQARDHSRPGRFSALHVARRTVRRD